MVTTSFQNLFVMKKGSIFVEGYETEFLNPAYNTPAAPPVPPVTGPEPGPGPDETEGPDGPIVVPAKTKKKAKAVKADE